MTVSAIIIRVAHEDRADALRLHLEAEPRCTPGPAHGTRMAAVLEFQTAAEGEALHGWLHGLPGVCGVDVLSALHHHQEHTPETGSPP